jgi:hypothetical protein
MKDNEEQEGEDSVHRYLSEVAWVYSARQGSRAK